MATDPTAIVSRLHCNDYVECVGLFCVCAVIELVGAKVIVPLICLGTESVLLRRVGDVTLLINHIFNIDTLLQEI